MTQADLSRFSFVAYLFTVLSLGVGLLVGYTGLNMTSAAVLVCYETAVSFFLIQYARRLERGKSKGD